MESRQKARLILFRSPTEGSSNVLTTMLDILRHDVSTQIRAQKVDL